MSVALLPTGAERRRASHVWEREEHDHYVEPAWCSERLFELSIFAPGMTVYDPSCGFGTIVESARHAGLYAYGADIVPRWLAPHLTRDLQYYETSDFFRAPHVGDGRPHAIVSNPPFKDAERYAALALTRVAHVVALLLPTKWIQGSKRSRWLATTPLHSVLCLCPRPSMPPGHVIAAGGKPGNGTVDFSWFIWKLDHVGPPQIGWLHRETRGSGASPRRDVLDNLSHNPADALPGAIGFVGAR